MLRPFRRKSQLLILARVPWAPTTTRQVKMNRCVVECRGGRGGRDLVVRRVLCC